MSLNYRQSLQKWPLSRYQSTTMKINILSGECFSVINLEDLSQALGKPAVTCVVPCAELAQG